MNAKPEPTARPILEWARETPVWWASSILKPKPRVDERFVIQQGVNSRASVNIHQVVGTDHADYMNKDWMYLLEQGRRMSMRLRDLAENPDYYLATDIVRNPTWCLATFDGGATWYVDCDGNHRSCIARFYLERLIQSGQKESAFVHGIQARHIQVDESMQVVVKFIEENHPNYRICVESTPVHRDDGVGWYMDTSRLSVHIQDTRYSHDRLDARTTVHDAPALLHWVQNRERGWFRRILTWI